MNALGYVYCISGGDKLKIGFSTNPSRRLQQIQTASADLLNLRYCLPASRDAEAKIHEAFSCFRLFGEWFSAEPAILNWFQGMGAEPWNETCPGLLRRRTKRLVAEMNAELARTRWKSPAEPARQATG